MSVRGRWGFSGALRVAVRVAGAVLLSSAVHAHAAGAPAQPVLSLARVPVPSRDVPPGLKQALTQFEQEVRAQALDCVEDVLPPARAEYRTTYQILLNDRRAYSIALLLQGDCGGAYPFEDIQGRAWTRTGEQIDPTELYALSLKTPADGYFVLRPEWVRLLQAGWKKGQSDPECRADFDQQTEVLMVKDSVLIRPEGLELVYQSSRALRACYTPVLIRYTDLAPYLNAAYARAIGWK